MIRTEGEPVPEVRLRLEVDYAGLSWNGTVELPAAALPDDRRLDAEGLRISSASREGAVVPFKVSPDGQAILLDPPPGGNGPISLVFSGTAETTGLLGLYRSRHGSGYALTTHCEPTGARKIFPCADRPDRKVRLHLTVRASADLDVISNTPIHSHRGLDNGEAEWVFEPTPPMSTYLFYLALGRFRGLPAPSEGERIHVRILGPPGREEAGRWAAEYAPRIVRACEEYYGIPYPLPKLDLLAITEHPFGAMENWGAISFQEARLLVDESSNSFARRDVVETIAHEVAHQWFGNLVTMTWWDDIWLNESFASLMETKITETVAPELDPWTDYFLRVGGASAALDGDSLTVTHPVRVTVDRPEEISQIFDEISYGKGASILSMLDSYLGAGRFRAGVTRYLEMFRFRNARTDDLWEALERASGEPVRAIAAPWTERPGLPVLTARLVETGLELTQRRFAYLGSTEAEPWPIPLVLDVDGRRERVLLTDRRQVVPVPSTATVHLNPGALGFYRVAYEGALLERLLRALPERPAADRWSVVNDLAAFLRSGDASWSMYLQAVRALRATDDRLVVDSIVGTLGGLAVAFPDLATVRDAALEELEFRTRRIGLEERPGEAPESGILRGRVTFMRVCVDRRFAEELAPRFAGWDRLDPDLRQATAIARVRGGGADGFRQVRDALDRAPTTSEALSLGRALAWSEDPARVEEILELASGGGINRSHVILVAVQAAANPKGREVAWHWLVRRLPKLTEMFRGSGYLPLLFEGSLPLVGLGRGGEVRDLFQKHPSAEGGRGLAKGLERLTVLERLRERLATATES